MKTFALILAMLAGSGGLGFALGFHAGRDSVAAALRLAVASLEQANGNARDALAAADGWRGVAVRWEAYARQCADAYRRARGEQKL